MRFTRLRIAGVALLGATLVFGAACDSDTDEGDSTPTTTATTTATPTVTPTEGTATGTPGEAAGGGIEPANPEAPPQGTLASAGGQVELGLGSYCWSPPGGEPGICADSIGIITSTSDLTVEAGETLTIADEEPGTLPWPPLAIDSATLWLAPDEPIQSEADYRAWQPDGGFEGGTPLETDSSEIGAHTITLPGDLEPGRYLLSIFYTAGEDRGSDATYGAILIVE